MGISFSKRHDHAPNHHQDHRPPPFPPPSSSNPPPPSPPPVLQSPQPPTYAVAANAPYPIEQPYFPAAPPRPGQQQQRPSFPPIPRPPPPPPPPPHQNYTYSYNLSDYYSRPVNVTGQYSNYRPYYNNVPQPQVSGWGPSAAAPVPRPPLNPAPYVEHQNAKKIKNDVNVHRDTIRLQLDVKNTDCHLVSFTFDAMVDGSITILYFAKEGPNCSFATVYPEIVPVQVPFQKGLGQKFLQPPGTGVDLGFFDIDDLSKPSPGEDVFPLIISAGTSKLSTPMNGHSNEKVLNLSSHAQISQAVLEKTGEGNFQVKVIKQILWIDGVRYELREIFGINYSDETTVSDVDYGKECVICMTEVKNTAVLPCRHMCMCSECAKELRLQSDKCPVCRQPIEELLEIKVDEEPPQL